MKLKYLKIFIFKLNLKDYLFSEIEGINDIQEYHSSETYISINLIYQTLLKIFFTHKNKKQ